MHPGVPRMQNLLRDHICNRPQATLFQKKRRMNGCPERNVPGLRNRAASGGHDDCVQWSVETGEPYILQQVRVLREILQKLAPRPHLSRPFTGMEPRHSRALMRRCHGDEM